MDISMYGHNQHNYTNPDNAYFNYEPCQAQGYASPGQIPSHYPHGTYPYEEPNTYIYSSESADTPPSPQDITNTYYATQQPQDASPIISTDAGLSYTNLDYANAHSTHGLYHQQNYQEVYPRGHHQELMLRHHPDDAVDAHAYLNDGKFLDGDSYAHLSSGASCMEYQQHARFKEEVMPENDRRLLHQHHQHGLGGAPQPQPVIPTYKWMQVKRNVPKPTGK